jgi:phage FluMu gp28-like protein
MDSSAVLLPYDLISSCESMEATKSVPAEFWFGSGMPPLFMGIDFARKRDLSVAWTKEKMGDVLHTREVVEMKAMSTPDQIDVLRPRIQQARRVCLDYTGPGVGMGDYLVKEFGEWNPDRHLYGKIELVTFTQASKVDLFSKLRMAFEAKRLRIPQDRVIREDLHSMQRVTSNNGGVSYRAPHKEDGHADRCTALALANRAGEGGRTAAVFETGAPAMNSNRRGRGMGI